MAESTETKLEQKPAKKEQKKKSSKKSDKPGFFKGVKSEFKKIVWPDRVSICKQTAAVVVISAVLGALIKLLDMLVQIGFDFII